MAVPISNVTRRIVFVASGTGPYAFTFEILAETDIAVYKDDTLLTLTTDYSVSINANGTGSVTLVTSPVGATQIAIVGDRAIERISDFVTGGDFFANTVNDEFDSLTIFAQQNSEAVSRALIAPQTDPTTINMTLPRKADRANKYLAFDSDGNPAPGDTAVEVAAIASISDEIEAVAGISTEIVAVDAVKTNVTTVAGIAPNVTTVAGIAPNVTTVAGLDTEIGIVVANITDIQNAEENADAAIAAKVAAEAARDATLTAYDNFDDRYLGAKASDPTVDNDGDALVAGALYFNSSSEVMRLYTGSAWVAAYVSGSGFLATANNLSDLANAGTARTNLGLVIGTDVQAFDATIVVDADIGVSVQAYDADTAKTDVAQTFTAKQTFSGSSSVASMKTSNIAEVDTIAATAATGVIDYDVATQSVLFYTTDASGNWTVNFRGSSGTSLDALMATGESISVTFLVTQGATAYYNSAVTVDGSSVTPKWQGGTAPTSGNASSVDCYTYVIQKTGAATYVVLASQTQFA
jgi:hypothetical protein